MDEPGQRRVSGARCGRLWPVARGVKCHPSLEHSLVEVPSCCRVDRVSTTTCFVSTYR